MKDLLNSNKNNFLELLLNTNLNMYDKQLQFEQLTQIYIPYSELSKNERYKIGLFKLYDYIKNIDWMKQMGKLYFKDFFKYISIDIFIDLILINFLLKLRLFTFEAISYIKDKLIEIVFDYLNKNKIKYDQNIVEKSCSYIVTILNVNKLFEYDRLNKIFIPAELLKLIDLNIDEIFLLYKFNWSLIIPANNYTFNINKNEFVGGYYLKVIPLICGHTEKIKLFEIDLNGLNVIHKLQNTKFCLFTNVYLKYLIKDYENYLSIKLNECKPELLNLYLEDWYACFQFNTFIDSNIYEIYYPFQMDFRGRIYNGINFGLNPTSNKLSRFLISNGKSQLNEDSLNFYKIYMLKFINKDLKELNKTIIEDINQINIDDILNFTNLEDILKIYSIETLILLIDWKYNVLIYNYSELNIELDASQSGFQMLSMLSNDYKGMINTNLIDLNDNNKIDLYTDILIKVHNNLDIKEWKEIVSRDLIKKIIMTIPYGSTKDGQLRMISESFKDQFMKKVNTRMLNLNKLDILLKSKVINDLELIEKLNKINELNKENLKINEYEELIEKPCIELYRDLLANLFSYFFPTLLKQITIVLNIEYLNIQNFINYIKNLKIKYIQTKYIKFSLIYYKIKKKEFKIKNSHYFFYQILDSYDVAKMNRALIANICHGFNSFIIQDIINNFDNIYPVHDAVLCKPNEIINLKKQINISYNTIYNYILNYDDFKNFYKQNNLLEAYKLNSLNMFKIK